MGRIGYDRTDQRRCGQSGLILPAISFGLWQNFGGPGTAAHGLDDEAGCQDRARDLVWTALDEGIYHLDLANNYGPPPGMAEERLGRLLPDLPRQELVISSKAGYRMWPGPHGDGGSRKYLVESCEASLRRMRLDHVDIFYHHRMDAETPLVETLGALDALVRQGKALYVGLSNYSGERIHEAMAVCTEHGFARPVIHQPSYSLLRRDIETDSLPACRSCGLGTIAFSVLAQGILSGRYLDGIPSDSRAGSSSPRLADRIDDELRGRLRKMQALAADCGRSIAQLALAWVVRPGAATSALMGASRPEQLREAAAGLRLPAVPDEVWTALDELFPPN